MNFLTNVNTPNCQSQSQQITGSETRLKEWEVKKASVAPRALDGGADKFGLGNTEVTQPNAPSTSKIL